MAFSKSCVVVVTVLQIPVNLIEVCAWDRFCFKEIHTLVGRSIKDRVHDPTNSKVVDQ